MRPRGSPSRSPRLGRQVRQMEKTEAIQQITQKVLLLENQRSLNNDLLAFYVEKLVGDILDYCHREDFPDTLIYTVVELIRKRLVDEAGSTDMEGMAVRGPLSSVKMDDTEFKFAVANVDATGCLADLDFDSIKPKLNLYRKVVSWA